MTKGQGMNDDRTSDDRPQPPGTEHFHDCGTQSSGVFRKLYWTFCQTCGFTTGWTRNKNVAEGVTRWHTEHPDEPVPTRLLR
jgi:hypothetical protein